MQIRHVAILLAVVAAPVLWYALSRDGERREPADGPSAPSSNPYDSERHDAPRPSEGGGLPAEKDALPGRGENSGRLRTSPHVTLDVRKKEEGDPTSNRVVYLVGSVSPEVVRRTMVLHVCGLPSTYQDDGSFEARRSFPKPGNFTVSAIVTETRLREDSRQWKAPQWKESVVGTADCRISLRDDPREDQSLRDLSEQALLPSGEVNRHAFHELIRSGDLRVVPTLWKIIDSDPGGDSIPRRRSISALGRMAHLDSVPRIVQLLRDKGAALQAHGCLSNIGLLGLDGILLSSAPSSEEEMDKLIAVLLSEFRLRERELRQALHQ